MTQGWEHVLFLRRTQGWEHVLFFLAEDSGLGAHTVLAEISVWFSAFLLGDSQLPMTPVSWDLMPSSGLIST